MSTGTKKRVARVPSNEDQERRKRILEGLQGRDLEQSFANRALWKDIREEANSADPDKLVIPDAIKAFEQARNHQLAGKSLGLFFSTDDVIIVPGLMGSELVDDSGK